MPPTELPADVPKTDRELLLQVFNDVKDIKSALNGKDGEEGLCKRVQRLERDRWYLAGALGLLILMVGAGRLIELLYVVPR